MGVLFEISIVCHVLCSWLVGGWFFWLPAVLCLAFFSVISLVVGGLGVLPGLLFVGGLGVAWLFCWGWVFFAWPVFSSMFVVGEEGGWVFPAWPSFVGVGCGLGFVLHMFGCGFLVVVLFGEFDPGSGRTLAACLTHASRTGLSSFLGVG